jgi:hypothetical protein
MAKFKFDIQLFATVGTNTVTLADIKARQDPNGLMAQVLEVLALDNQILADMRWMEGNLPTGNVTTQRSSIPKPGTRRLNEGAKKSKSSTKQVTDTCCILEDNSEIDEETLSLAPNKEAYRTSEDAAFTEGFRQECARLIFYGNTDSNEAEFNGLDVRYNKISTVKTKPGYQIISAGGSGSDNASAWLIDHDANGQGMAGIYPKGSVAGLDTRDMGLQRLVDSNGNPYYGYCTNFKWKPGIAVKNYRKVSRVANIDTSDLITFGSGSDTSPNLIQKFILAQNRIHNKGGSAVWYVNELVYSWLQIMLMDKKNVYITRQELMGKAPQLYFNGDPVRMCDALLSTEATIS